MAKNCSRCGEYINIRCNNKNETFFLFCLNNLCKNTGQLFKRRNIETPKIKYPIFIVIYSWIEITMKKIAKLYQQKIRNQIHGFKKITNLSATNEQLDSNFSVI